MKRTMISTENSGILVPKKRVMRKITPRIELRIPQRGSSGPVRIGKLIEPFKELISHPDRNRLLAELFKDYQ